VTGIIDCDHLPLAPRGYDLGYYLTRQENDDLFDALRHPDFTETKRPAAGGGVRLGFPYVTI